MLVWLGYLLQIAVAIIAREHTKRCEFHHPVSRFATWLAVVDLARFPLEATRPHCAPLFVLDELTFLSIPASLCYTTLLVTERCGITSLRHRKAFFGIAFAAALLITIGHPYSASFWVYAVVQAACVGCAWYHIGRAFWLGKCWMGTTELALLAYLSGETIVLMGDYFSNWPNVTALMLGINLIVLAIHLVWEASVRVKTRQEYH